MLAPEVWNFKPPSCAQQMERGKLSNAHECVDFCISTHHFNHSVSVVIPTREKLPKNIETGPSAEHSYYVVKNLPVVEFISQDFINNFVKQGKSSAISIDTAIDCDNCVCLSPSGTLVLNLNRVDYERLGLEGQPSFFCRLKPPSRYVVKIDLTEECFKPSKKNYERVIKCLLQNLKLEMDFLVAWNPPSDDVCTSSIAAYFDSLGLDVSKGNTTFTQKKYIDAQVPSNLTECEAEEVFEWIGAVSIGADMANWYDSSTEFNVEDDTVNIPLQTLQWIGFHSSDHIEKYVLQLREFLSANPSVPWFCIHVQGFEDSAISWKLNENFFHQSAENSYSIVIDCEQRFLLSKMLGANRKAKPHSK